ncbi:MAG: AAA family ATPase [Bacteroidetes bacterium]|nr:AAA family ATPase [Bacteroidota bacterium]
MSIFNHFKHLNLSQGQETALTKLEAFLASPVQVFMLKGYAGSGKTTILKGLVEYLNLNKKEFILMAPTGRAAKVLRDKTGHGVTIHKGIYNFAKLESVNQNSEDDAEHSFHYYFPINEAGTSEKIIIVDESSMISSVESKNELFTFGTNILLNDLMTFARLQTSKSKVIFVGDPAQLPPYGDSKSLALDKNYFNDLGIVVEETEMTEVLRQGDNLILKNAKQIRELLAQDKRIQLQFQFDDDSFIKTQGEDLVRKFTDFFPVPEIGNGIVISFSNTQCYHYNTAIREKIFPKQKEVVSGDLLLINNNNYHTYGAELFNGDIAKVISVDTEIVTQSAPVFCDIDGKKVRRIITLKFRKITIRIPSHPDEINCYIIDSLYSLLIGIYLYVK